MAFDDVEPVTSATGATLAMRFSPADGPPRALIQINHGVSEHSGRYGRFARFLNARGFHVYAHDHRGHGLTKAPGAPAGRFAQSNGLALVLDDVDAINELSHSRHPGLPVIVFGHSMGGLIAFNYALKHPGKIDAAAIWNANFSAGVLGRLAQGILRAERMFLGSDVPSMVLPKLTFQEWGRSIKNGRTASDWLSRDPDEVDAYLADPLSGWNPTVSMWRDIFGFIFAGSDDGLLNNVPRDMPFNLVGGAEDPATAKGRAIRDLESRLRKFGFTNVTARIYEDTRHEGLNEINREVVMQDFVDWAGQVVSRRTMKLKSA
ncbi:alpha/beta hydrolase [Phyllobacterium lublinensis]|uniref:alpha/beta hydrolase n=1 Tax=Phyllobacterium lublinensis TaxID=2875708 RepID=UPI001CCE18FB|nr:alpha/beta hydrolase [Phyllobacterium sp. 2063]MBZ9656809.1 alpha/beta hydrolase [Phyllobacterium sp. 2063]